MKVPDRGGSHVTTYGQSVDLFMKPVDPLRESIVVPNWENTGRESADDGR